ncbi:MAG: ribosome maturation factor RimP [Acidimicrobiales bacterium]
MDVTARLVDALSAVLESSGLELVDLVVGGSQVQVTVDRPGGIDLEALAEANREVSRVLDELDPFPNAYTLEVSSPGLERKLRTPAHFARAVGEIVSVRTLPDVAIVRRVQGLLSAADDVGCTIEGAEIPDGAIRLAYDQIERARTVFEWGSDKRVKPGKGPRSEKERSRS